MDKQIINIENVDTTKQPLFFGKGLNLQRYDKQRYKKIYDLFLQHLSFFWRPEEVSLEKEYNETNAIYLLTKNELKSVQMWSFMKNHVLNII